MEPQVFITGVVISTLVCLSYTIGLIRNHLVGKSTRTRNNLTKGSAIAVSLLAVHSLYILLIYALVEVFRG